MASIVACGCARKTFLISRFRFKVNIQTYINSRNYASGSRGLRRKPLQVFEKREIDDINDGLKSTGQSNFSLKKILDEEEEKATLNLQMEGKSQGRLFEISYEKLKDGDKKFSSLVMAAKSKKTREKNKIILLEGTRLISDALLARAHLKTLYFSDKEILNKIPFQTSDVKLYKVSYKQMSLWTDLTTSPGVMGVFSMPEKGEIEYQRSKTLPLTVICDNIREPSNMGSLLRAAAAAGCDRVLVNKGCVDIWEPKVLRAGSGAHFRVPVINNLTWAMIPNYLEDDSEVIIADNNYQENKRDCGTQKIREGEVSRAELETLPYYEFECSSHEHTTLVVGGETEGLSNDAYTLALQRDGKKVFIPLLAGFDSLNSSMAASIIIFEMQRQLISSQ